MIYFLEFKFIIQLLCKIQKKKFVPGKPEYKGAGDVLSKVVKNEVRIPGKIPTIRSKVKRELCSFLYICNMNITCRVGLMNTNKPFGSKYQSLAWPFQFIMI